MFAASQAPQNSVLGHIVTSAYDYVISETLGFHVDFNKTLGQQYDDVKKKSPEIKNIPQSKFDSLTEKCERAVKDIHRPIVWSETAKTARISSNIGGRHVDVGGEFDIETYEYIDFTERSNNSFSITGKVSSYNINTFKGRMYLSEEGRPIPFELAPTARDSRSVSRITESLTVNARTRFRQGGEVNCVAFRDSSKTGRLKKLFIVEVS